MLDETISSLAPLQGCLVCHMEGTTELSTGRRLLSFGQHYPRLQCSYCGSVALLDISGDGLEEWRIRYTRINRAERYFYAAAHLGQARWLSAKDALAISTDAFVQRRRVQQVKAGDLTWLQLPSLRPPPPCVSPGEQVFLVLKAVTYHETVPPGLFSAKQGAVLDSGKLYVTGQNLHLLGQRRDWTYRLNVIQRISYDADAWAVHLNTPDAPPQHLRGMNVTGQMDSQLVAAVIEILWYGGSAKR